jgi:hypothetical protein
MIVCGGRPSKPPSTIFGIRSMAEARSKPRRQSVSLADLVAPTLGPLLARRGFGEADIILHWDDIVGARLAGRSEPVKLQWPPRGPRGSPDASAETAILVVRVEGAFALELQHLAPIVVERINSHLGWRCVGRLALRQGPLERQRRLPRKAREPSPAARAAAQRAAAGIEDPDLRDALVRLGVGVISRSEG